MKYISVRIARAVLALVLIGHALIHLGIIPGGIQGPDGRTGWSGHSGLLDQFLGAPVVWVIAMALLAGTILFFVAGITHDAVFSTMQSIAWTSQRVHSGSL